jgi:hypothetical protein
MVGASVSALDIHSGGLIGASVGVRGGTARIGTVRGPAMDIIIRATTVIEIPAKTGPTVLHHIGLVLGPATKVPETT